MWSYFVTRIIFSAKKLRSTTSVPTPYTVHAISSFRGRMNPFHVGELYSRANPTASWQMHVRGGAMGCGAPQSLRENLLGGGRLVSNTSPSALLQKAGVLWWVSSAPGLTISLDKMFSEPSAGWVSFPFTGVRTAAQSEDGLQNISPLSLCDRLGPGIDPTFSLLLAVGTFQSLSRWPVHHGSLLQSPCSSQEGSEESLLATWKSQPFVT